MSAPASNAPCPRTDAVLALHLDGDLGGPLRPDESGYEFVCPQSLTEHLQDCASCQQALRRARRLDACLAEAAGRRGAGQGDALDRLLTYALPADLLHAAANTVETQASAPTRSVWRRLAALAAVAALLLTPVLWLPWLQRCAPQVTEQQLADLQMPGWRRDPQPAVAEQEHDATRRRTDPLLVAADAARRVRRLPPETAPQSPPPLATLADAAAPTPLRLLAGQHLLRELDASPAANTAATRDLAAAVTAALASTLAEAPQIVAPQTAQPAPAQQPTRDLAAALLDAARGSPRLINHLRQTLSQLANSSSVPGRAEHEVIGVAALLAQRDLDAALVRVVRRWPELASVLAAALRQDRGGGGRAALRFDAWQALAVRGELDEDFGSAALWFAGAPATTFAELDAELAASRTAARRMRCLLAMGCCDDARTLPWLLRQLGAARQDDALAAAYALSHLPHRDLQPLVPTARRERDAWLLRAALTQAGLLGDLPGNLLPPQWTAQGAPAEVSLSRFITFAHGFRERLPSTGG